jgi:hypothetical protein
MSKPFICLKYDMILTNNGNGTKGHDVVESIDKFVNTRVTPKMDQGYQPVGGINVVPYRSAAGQVEYMLTQSLIPKSTQGGGKGTKRRRIRKNVSRRRQ